MERNEIFNILHATELKYNIVFAFCLFVALEFLNMQPLYDIQVFFISSPLHLKKKRAN